MYTVFRSPTIIDRKNIQMENNQSARKPGQLSCRKPFGERSVNLKDNGTPALVKPQIITKTVLRDEPSYDMSQHICSYKHVKDTYNDLYNEKDFLNEHGLKNIYACFLDNGPEKLTMFYDTFEPEPLEIIKHEESFSYDADDVCNLFDNDFNINLDDVPFPELEFNF